jgi:hypothetical protein
MNITAALKKLDKFIELYNKVNPPYTWREYMRDLREILLALQEPEDMKGKDLESWMGIKLKGVEDRLAIIEERLKING